MKKIISQNIILISMVIILITIIVIIININYRNQQAHKELVKQRAKMLPTQTPTLPVTQYLPSPTTAYEQSTADPLVKWDQSASDLLFSRAENRKSLSQSDLTAKKEILKNLPSGKTSGTIYSSTNISIDYSERVDLFQIEINTVNIDLAKQEGVQWLTSQGLSLDAICNYPVQFYLSWNIMNELAGQNIVFSPLAPGCQ